MNKYKLFLKSIFVKVRITMLILSLVLGAMLLTHEFDNVQYMNKIIWLKI